MIFEMYINLAKKKTIFILHSNSF